MTVPQDACCDICQGLHLLLLPPPQQSLHVQQCCLMPAGHVVGMHLQLGQAVVELEGQLDMMEHQCRSLNQDKEQLEEELHDKEGLLHQAAANAQHAQAEAAQATRASNARCSMRHMIVAEPVRLSVLSLKLCLNG